MPPLIVRSKRSSPLALAVLVLLFERPMHPYEMAATIKERHMEDSIKLRYGSLYTVIENLARDGLIVPRETQRDGRRPERTIYELTPGGEREFRAWMRELLRAPVKEYPQFEAALALLAGLPREEVAALLRERITALRTAAAQTRTTLAETQSQGLPLLFLVETAYHLKMTEAEIEFVEELVGQIVRDGCGWAGSWQRFHEERQSPRTRGAGAAPVPSSPVAGARSPTSRPDRRTTLPAHTNTASGVT
jgi:DNA-binding PadR family transcriptional regulator